ncbi:MAG TPA: SAM-dependent methyltransferase [Terriglobales bacterium]|nr:SAM-dependent methyltransferase [Terriglobales bacterium]
MSLRHLLEQEIRERGSIPFSRYMEMCLYHPEFGYYSRNAEQFGKAGDFYTSSDVHAVFGRLLARQFEEIWRVLGSPPKIEILELGPGRGLFAQDVLDWSQKKFPAFSQALHYSLLEGSAALRGSLEQTLARFIESGRASLLVDMRALATPGPAIVFANEFFDALPVEILGVEGKLAIALQDNRFTEIWTPPAPEELKFLDQYGVHPEPGELIEVPLQAHRYMSSLADSLCNGIVIAIDYGYTRQEQIAGRHRGTLMAYREHSAGTNPYEAPGEQDITAHVNFTSLSAAAEQNGMMAQPLLTQSQFLMGIGEKDQFADAFADCRLPQERAKVALQLKHLVTPAGMGESFQVMVAAKNIENRQIADLSGLSFARSRLPGMA